MNFSIICSITGSPFIGISGFGKTFVKGKRLLALEDAISQNFEIAIFDDGLQDYTISYDLSLVCFNKMNWVGNGLMIPAGPLREDFKSIRNYENFFLNGNHVLFSYSQPLYLLLHGYLNISNSTFFFA